MEYNQPLFFTPNRVWRLYTGGLLIDWFRGANIGIDSHLPEDWLASTVLAKNGEHSQSEQEGLASIVIDGQAGPYLREILTANGVDILGARHFQQYGANTAVLCKYLDSAVRLPIQCHPDAEISKKLFNSPFGKTECWHIIETRKINREEPYILLGFKPGIDAVAFANAVKQQDLPAMIEMLHRIPVKAGETYFVPARMPHAIGTGVFMLEVQEPSDWVIQPEQYCADIKLNHADMWGILSPEQGLEVFDYTGLSKEELINRVSPSNRIFQLQDNLEVKELIGPGHTRAFSLWKVTITGRAEIQLPTEFAIIVVEKGNGDLHWNGEKKNLKQSDCFLKPASLKRPEFSSENSLELLVCLPPVV